MKRDYNNALWILIFFVIGMNVKGIKAEMVSMKTTIIWERSIEGNEVGYPLVDADRCYLTFNSEKKLQVLALNLNNGEKVWQTALPYYRDVLPLASDGQRIFVQTNSLHRGNIFTLNGTSGNLEWVCKGKVLILSRHFPYIFNRAELLTSEIVPSRKNIFVPFGASRLLAFNPETGEKRWEISLGWRYAPVKIDLINDLLYWKVGGDFFKVIDTKSGEEASSPLPEFVHSQISKLDTNYCIDQNRLFLRLKKDTGDQIICYDLATGNRLWNIEGDFLFPIKCEDNILYAYKKHRGIGPDLFSSKYSLVSIDGKTGKIYWSVPGKLTSFIQKSGDYILINHEKKDSQLIAAKDGSLVWESKDFAEKRRIKGQVSCIIDGEGSYMLLIIGKSIFWMWVRQLGTDPN